MRVKLYLTIKDNAGHTGSISFPVDLDMPVLETENGMLKIKEITGMHVDCMTKNERS